ncbi:hypothetical protein [Tenacibaculum ovolyticum]|uniref:hypothetical protein n=1 Tax=Tenacibaculum ovolyticum TaxID=104270 RepID=UPI0007ECE1E6|nr:hypothetical protein [Tenacibaculum ovolyticum]
MINQATVPTDHEAILKAESLIKEAGFNIEQKYNSFYIENNEKTFTAKLYLEIEKEFSRHFFRTSFYHDKGVSVLSFYKYK